MRSTSANSFSSPELSPGLICDACPGSHVETTCFGQSVGSVNAGMTSMSSNCHCAIDLQCPRSELAASEFRADGYSGVFDCEFGPFASRNSIARKSCLSRHFCPLVAGCWTCFERSGRSGA